MAIELTPALKLIKPNPGQERGRWGQHWNDNADKLDTLVSLNRKRVLQWNYPIAVAGTQFPLGFEEVLASSIPIAAPVVASLGTSRLAVKVTAGADLDGVLTLTGDSRSIATGGVTVGDSETVAIAGAGVYTSGKVWVGDVTVTPTTVDISDADLLALSLFANAGQPFEIEKVQLLAKSTAASASLTATLKTFRLSPAGFAVVEELGGKLDIGPTLAGTKRWDMTCEPSISKLGLGEGIVASLAFSGSPGDWADIQFLLSYKVQPNATL
jgi:hypothetical protein